MLVKKIIYFLILVALGGVFLSGQKTFHKKVRKKSFGAEVSIPLDLKRLPDLKVSEGQVKQIFTSELPFSDSNIPLIKHVEEISVAKIKPGSDEPLKVASPAIALLKEPQGYQYPSLQEHRIVRDNSLENTKNSNYEFDTVVEHSSLKGSNLKQIPNDQVENSKRVFVNSLVNAQLPLVSVQVPDLDPLPMEKIVLIPEQKSENTGGIDVVSLNVEDVSASQKDVLTNEVFGEEKISASVVSEIGDIEIAKEPVEEVKISSVLNEERLIVDPIIENGTQEINELVVLEDSKVEEFQFVEQAIALEDVSVLIEDPQAIIPDIEELIVKDSVIEDFPDVEIVEKFVEDLVATENLDAEIKVNVLIVEEAVEKEIVKDSVVDKVVDIEIAKEPVEEFQPVEQPIVLEDVSVLIEEPQAIVSDIEALIVKDSVIEDFLDVEIVEEFVEDLVAVETLDADLQVSVPIVEEAVELGIASVLIEQPRILQPVIEEAVEKEIVKDLVVDEGVSVGVASNLLEQPRVIKEVEKVGLLSIIPSDLAVKQSFVGKYPLQNNMSTGLVSSVVEMSTEISPLPIILEGDPVLDHEKGKFIVKFKSQGKHALDQCAHCLLASKTLFQLALEDGSSSVDQLNKDCGVREAKSVFVQRHGITTQEAMDEEDLKYSLIKSKFPQRTARIAKNAEIPDLTNFYIMEVPDQADIDSICELYSKDPHVEFAQPVHLMKIEAFPTDPPNDTFYASDQWDMNNSGQTGGTVDADIDAPEAWVENLGNNIIVAINDTGVDYNHVDLATNIWSNTDETVNGVDSDGNGYIDDIRGWDFYDNDNDPLHDPSPLTSTFHGTHVAGTVAAVGNNGMGVIGVAPNAKIMPVKGFGVSGGSVVGSSSTLAPGIVYAAQNGADVINNSWGCSSACPSDATVEAAVSTAYGLGSVVVFAAGNEDADVVNYSPQNMAEPVVVASSDDDDLNSSFSSFGSTVDVIAPGSNIASTYPDDQYAYSSGTSMAAPHTAGLAALILSKNSSLNLTSAQVEAVLQDTSDSYNKLSGDTANDYGDGRINAYNAVTLNNIIPTMSAGIDRSVDYGNLLQFTVSASDPLNDSLTLTAVLSAGGTLGSIGVSFTDNGDKTGQISWTPTVSQIGLNPTLSFTATDPDSFSHSDTMLITVNSGAVCGDGTIDVGEQCDDSNTTACDGCSSNCQTEVCGNGTQECSEGCDDGNTTSGDGCTSICVAEFCGDGVDNNGSAEQCDDSNTTACDGCSATCQTEACGNGNQECSEGCDDGNTTSGDGCTSTCVAEICGDGAINNGGSEQCDDGNTTSGDGCTAACIDEFCGDGVVNDGGLEECDDGNSSSLDGCSTSCVIVSVCGDLICEMGENCSSCWQDCGRCRGGSRPRR